jgi:hypothetical protein
VVVNGKFQDIGDQKSDIRKQTGGRGDVAFEWEGKRVEG